MSDLAHGSPGQAREPAYRLRAMDAEDLPAVLAVETAAFPTPWTREMFEEEIRHPLSWNRVVELEHVGVVGFVVCRFYGDVWHVMDLALKPAYRHRGLAGRLLDEFLGYVSPDTPVVLEVREGNEAAKRLYAGRGFREAGRRPGYYRDTHEAALLMVHGPEVDW